MLHLAMRGSFRQGFGWLLFYSQSMKQIPRERQKLATPGHPERLVWEKLLEKCQQGAMSLRSRTCYPMINTH